MRKTTDDISEEINKLKALITYLDLRIKDIFENECPHSETRELSSEEIGEIILTVCKS